MVKKNLKNELDLIIETITMVHDGNTTREKGEEIIYQTLKYMKFEVMVLFDLIELDRWQRELSGEGK